MEGYAFWIGRGLANRYIMAGKLLTVKEALSCGLVDEVCPLEELLVRAEQKMQQFLQAHPAILSNTKQKLRKDWMDKLELDAEADLEQALNLWWQPEIRARMKAFIERITKK